MSLVYSFSFKRASEIVTLAVFSGLLAVNFWLVRQNKALQDEVTDVRRMRGLEAAPGTKVPPLNGLDLSGAPLRVEYGNHKKTLILVFSPVCAFCERNWPQWHKVLGSLNRSRLQSVLVDLTSSVTPAFLAQKHFEKETVMAHVDPAAYDKYSFRVTPQTILVDETGSVVHVWTGLLTNREEAEILALTAGMLLAPPVPAFRRVTGLHHHDSRTRARV